MLPYVKVSLSGLRPSSQHRIGFRAKSTCGAEAAEENCQYRPVSDPVHVWLAERAFEKSLLKVPQIEGTFFCGFILKGLPHMVVRDWKDR